MTKLKISNDLALPLKFLSVRKVVFGGSGSGKTAFGRTLFEEANAAGVLCGAIDLKGDWWGLKSTADGKDDGIPVVVFGGEHQDVPLDENGGAALAEIVVDLQQPFVIDLEQLSRGKQLRFLGPFFDRLYDKNREPLVLFCDEADRYAPQKPMSPEANICLGATEDIAKRGRKHGVFPIFITQRNASLNKNVSELCEVAIVFRTTGPNDQEAVKDWFGTKATREQRDQVMEKIAGIETGTAIFCSAHPELKFFKTVPVRLPWTFDSSATPEIGKRRIEPKHLAKPDLEKLKERMAVTIEKAKAEDPKALRAENAKLRSELAKKAPAPQVAGSLRGDVVIIAALRKALEEAVKFIVDINAKSFFDAGGEAIDKKKINQAIEAATQAVEKLAAQHIEQRNREFADLRKKSEHIIKNLKVLLGKDVETKVQVRANQPFDVTSAPARTLAAGSGNGVVSGGLRRMMIALAQRPQGMSAKALGVRAGLSSSSGTFGTYLGKGRAEGWIEGGRDVVRITTGGVAALGEYVPLPEGPELLAYWLGELGQSGAARMLRALAEAYPKGLTKEEVAEAANISASSGTFGTYLGKLRTLELVTGKGELAASEELF